VQQGDTVLFTAFVVNGEHHEVAVQAPDGQVVVPLAMSDRGKEYRVSFVAEKMGTYRLICSMHASSMAANVLVLPR
jgi:plastocyanin